MRIRGISGLGYRIFGYIVVFKEVSAEVCNNCGEYYLDDETAGEVLQKANDAISKGAELEVINMKKTA